MLKTFLIGVISTIAIFWFFINEIMDYIEDDKKAKYD